MRTGKAAFVCFKLPSQLRGDDANLEPQAVQALAFAHLVPGEWAGPWSYGLCDQAEFWSLVHVVGFSQQIICCFIVKKVSPVKSITDQRDSVTRASKNHSVLEGAEERDLKKIVWSSARTSYWQKPLPSWVSWLPAGEITFFPQEQKEPTGIAELGCHGAMHS